MTAPIRPGDRHGYHLKWCDLLDELNERCYVAVSEVLAECALERMEIPLRSCGKRHLTVLTHWEDRMALAKVQNLIYPAEMLADRETMRIGPARIDPKLPLGGTPVSASAPLPRKCLVVLTDDEWRRIRVAAAEDDTTIQGWLTNLVLAALPDQR